ncbi:hypothetical protein DFJ74DRAFT_654304 [Hyaloraphidium curvatum]|nr:hypothetical protein DFJ74DRAFT_654304 [Hyaloraphidium curvatum]
MDLPPWPVLLRAAPWWIIYHVVVLYAISRCLSGYSWNAGWRAKFWPSLALGSLVLAWINIYKFICMDYVASGQGSLEGYLNNSDLFVNAYRRVTENERGWWWSWQLLAWTCTVVFRMWEQGAARLLKDEGDVASEDQPSGMDRVWHLIAGFFGAMSTCGAFFFGRIHEETSSLKSTTPIPIVAYLPPILGLVTIFSTPSIAPDSPAYTYNLIGLHVILCIPILALFFRGHLEALRGKAANIDSFAVYLILTLWCLAYHAYTTFTLLSAVGFSPGRLVDSLVAGFRANPAQASIACDAVAAAAVTLAYMNKDGDPSRTRAFWTINMMLVGPAVVLPAWLMIERASAAGRAGADTKSQSRQNAPAKESPSRQEKRRAEAAAKKKGKAG